MDRPAQRQVGAASLRANHSQRSDFGVRERMVTKPGDLTQRFGCYPSSARLFFLRTPVEEQDLVPQTVQEQGGVRTCQPAAHNSDSHSATILGNLHRRREFL